MYIKVQGQTYLLNIGVADNLPYPAVLGRGLPMFFELLNSSHECNVTRTQAKKEEEPFQSLPALPFYGSDQWLPYILSIL